MSRRTLLVLLTLLALFLLGALGVLSAVSWYLAIHPAAFLTEPEVFAIQYDPLLNNTGTAPHPNEKIPRILHQTWREETLPDRWRAVSQGCKDLMPDYEYILWTDKSSRDFIEEHYPWFLDTFDGYKFPIQRADAIRYFVLYHFGGIYFDLDVGCLHRFDPLLHYDVVLPKTIPVGVSNDLMFSAKGHPFLEQAIRHLITFDHSYIMNYPTVMFSTGPMFLSAQYGLYTSSHPFTPDDPGGDVRILPKSLYGKNAKVEEAPNAFVSHHYGSSWHADDAAFILFLGHSGTRLMWVGFFVLIVGLLRLFLQALQPNRRGYPRSLHKRLDLTEYDLILPRSRYGSYHLDMLAGGSSTPTTTASPLSSPTYTSPPSPTLSSWIPSSVETGASTSITDFSSLFKRPGPWVRAHVPGDPSSFSAAGPPRSSGPSRGSMDRARGGWARGVYNKLGGSSGGVTVLLPAIFAMPSSKNTASFPNAAHGLGMGMGMRGGSGSGRDGVPRLRMPTPGRRHADSRARMETRMGRELAMRDLEAGGAPSLLPPPYSSMGASRRQQSRLWNTDDDAWDWPASSDSS